MPQEAKQMGLFMPNDSGPDAAAEGRSSFRGRNKSLITILPPADVFETLRSLKEPAKVVMLDPWYNKGFGGIRDDYDDWLADLVRLSSEVAEHVYVWGFPEIVWRLLNNLPDSLTLVA